MSKKFTRKNKLKSAILKPLITFSLLYLSFLPSAQTGVNDINIYGYLSWRTEKVWEEIQLDGSKEDAAREITIPSFNLMMLNSISDKSKVFINLSGAEGEDVEVKNIWGEYKVNNFVSIRLGKMYRRFGLYNEQLDAVPTYIGIEPPELFDKDHLILSRETLSMVHGWVSIGEGELNYSFSMDNGEGGPTAKDNVPLGYDLRYEFGLGDYVVGISGYTSGGDTTSDKSIGEGSPRTGVLPWMSKDKFSIFGAFGQFQIDELQLQAAYWSADHKATRNSEDVLIMLTDPDVDGEINQIRQTNFLLDGDINNLILANINTNGDYEVVTWYLRAGYTITTKNGEFVPYVQWDEYENPETVFGKKNGGDKEAGLADDGKFRKSTVGVIYRPEPNIAVKLDFSTHFQKVRGKDTSYSEVRFDVSYIFGQ
ncbi:MAG: hypothetical protein KUG78_21250 [Kangiellaceae bacterium]|nr:hypothetical protein [Kangiellaceae bacterium]